MILDMPQKLQPQSATFLQTCGSTFLSQDRYVNTTEQIPNQQIDQTKKKEQIMKCKMCGKEYDQKETIRIYGNGTWTIAYCSAQCHTQAVMERTQDVKENNRMVSNKMLEAAMKKACEIQLFPRVVDTDTYLKHWDGMKRCIQAALDAD
jgi:hypothetical protein